MTRYHPRSPGTRLSALRRALWEEDRARERLDYVNAVHAWDAWEAVALTYRNAVSHRRYCETDLWEAQAGHGLD